MICSRTPSEKLPRPSNEPGSSPRKSRMRGSATDTSLSRNSYMRAPRSVTFAPTAIPSRSLKLAIDLRALRTWARWPAIVVSSSIAASRAFAFADADADGLALDLLDPDPDPRRQVADGADQHHVGNVDRGRLLDPAARGHLRPAHAVRVAQRARARVPRHHVQVLDEHTAVARARLDDAALLAAVLPGQDLDQVALLDLHLVCHVSQSTSGARLTIFMKFFSRSSRATGPKMRVPRGLRAASMITAAFSSNAICVPSLRPYGFFVRTTTACTTSPFLIVPCGVAVFTVPTITSPT